MFDSWSPPTSVGGRSAEAERRADVVFGWIFDAGIVVLSVLALLML